MLFKLFEIPRNLSFLRHFWQTVVAVAFGGPLSPGIVRYRFIKLLQAII
jgi:hypothetical protein